MLYALLFHRKLRDFLLRIERVEAERAREAGCCRCGGVPHSAEYGRKPRGVPCALAAKWADLAFRHGFCCGDGRRRTTPASVRFFGRQVYVGLISWYACAMENRSASPEKHDRCAHPAHVHPCEIREAPKRSPPQARLRLPCHREPFASTRASRPWPPAGLGAIQRFANATLSLMSPLSPIYIASAGCPRSRHSPRMLRSYARDRFPRPRHPTPPIASVLWTPES